MVTDKKGEKIKLEIEIEALMQDLLPVERDTIHNAYKCELAKKSNWQVIDKLYILYHITKNYKEVKEKC